MILLAHVFDLELSKEMLPPKLQNTIHEQMIHTTTKELRNRYTTN